MTTTVASPDESDDEPELTPEQRKKLQRHIQGISNNLVPRIEIPKIDLGIDTTAIARITADVARLGHNQIPQTWLKDYTAASILADQSAKILAGLQPYFDIQSALQQQLAPITSDLIKWTMPVQPQLNFLSSQLLKNIDFGWTDEIARIGQQFASYQSKWLEDLKPLLAQVTSDFYPSNLGNDFTLDQIEQVVMLDGIALYEMPRAEIVTPLICASSSAARREILGRRWKAIAVDCRGVLDSCESPEAAPLAKFAVDAVDALEGGNPTSAQALAGSLLDTILRKFFADQRLDLLPSKKTTNTDAYLERTVKEFIAIAPIWQAYQQYYPDKNDPIPRAFNRHATAHTVGTLQYSRRNAVQGLMIVCGLLKFIDQQAVGKRKP